jgi:hypothetical protein
MRRLLRILERSIITGCIGYVGVRIVVDGHWIGAGFLVIAAFMLASLLWELSAIRRPTEDEHATSFDMRERP